MFIGDHLACIRTISVIWLKYRILKFWKVFKGSFKIIFEKPSSNRALRAIDWKLCEIVLMQGRFNLNHQTSWINRGFIASYAVFYPKLKLSLHLLSSAISAISRFYHRALGHHQTRDIFQYFIKDGLLKIPRSSILSLRLL